MLHNSKYLYSSVYVHVSTRENLIGYLVSEKPATKASELRAIP